MKNHKFNTLVSRPKKISMESPENSPNSVEKKRRRLNVEDLKSLQRKIYRYTKQQKFSQNEIDHIDLLFKNDLSNTPKHTSENDMGIMRVLNDYSSETIDNIKDFIKECEDKWAQETEDKLFRTKTKNSKKRGSITGDGSASKKPKKKPKTVDNPLIQAVRSETPDDNDNAGQMIPSVDDNGQKTEPKEKEKHPLTSQMKIIDYKKHPLSFYKGPLRRAMRVVRNIGNLNAIQEYSKGRTSEVITYEPTDSNAAAENIAADNEDDDVNEEEFNHESGESEEVSSEGFDNQDDGLEEDIVEESDDDDDDDDDSDIGKDAFDDLDRRYNDFDDDDDFGDEGDYDDE